MDNNCTKSGAKCTNTVGSFNCTCQTRYFWNGMKCEGLFTLILFNPMWTSFQGVFLTIFLSVSPSFSLFFLVQCSLFVIIPIIGLSVCLSFLSVCLIIVNFVRLFIFPSACNSLSKLKRRNRISVSFSLCDGNSNGDKWRGHVFRQKDGFFEMRALIWSAILVNPELLPAKTTKHERHPNASFAIERANNSDEHDYHFLFELYLIL